MPIKLELKVPDHLVDIFQPTPSGVAKLLAAWDGLHPETQILILNRLGALKFPEYLAVRVRTEALKSDNGYVRYLAAKELRHNATRSLSQRAIAPLPELPRLPLTEQNRMGMNMGRRKISL